MLSIVGQNRALNMKESFCLRSMQLGGFGSMQKSSTGCGSHLPTRQASSWEPFCSDSKSRSVNNLLKCSDLGSTGSNTCFLLARTPARIVAGGWGGSPGLILVVDI
jgi:hypothetical protein